MVEIYLDNSATTKVSEEAAKAVLKVMKDTYGNPSSLHKMGLEAEKLMKQAREKIALGLGVKADEIYFTSGGTEANNLAIKGAAHTYQRRGKHLITTVIEHPSVLDVFRYLEKTGFKVTYLQVDREGQICIEDLKKALTPETILVSMMYVNNEMGAILPIEEVVEILSDRENTLLHVDAVQAFGKINFIPRLSGIDMVSLSSHKIHGSKGVGALFIRDGVRVEPLILGGGQEKNIRSGTENLPGIVGFGVSAQEILDKNPLILQDLKARLVEKITREIPGTVINGPKTGGVPHIANISFLGTRAEILLHSLEAKGIYVSTGSACSSRRVGDSHVLLAMGKSPEEIEGAIRFSLSFDNTPEDIDYTVVALQEEVEKIRKVLRR